MEFSSVLNSELLNFSAPSFSLAELVHRLGLATVLGIALSIVCRLTDTGGRKKKRNERTLLSMQHTHILVCIGGAFIMIIIGNNLANAFGLTGALSMIRFRTNQIDPKEAATIILLIGVGMACGLELPLTAISMSVLTSFILWGMYWQHQILNRRKAVNNTDAEEGPLADDDFDD